MDTQVHGAAAWTAYLRRRIRGQLIDPADAEYESARKVYNAMHDRHPGAILRAEGVPDVVTAVQTARDYGLLLAVRGGGHSVPGFGTCDDGLVLDLGRMRDVRVDAESRTAVAEGGCTWADVNAATAAFGLAVTGGVVSSTGIGGLTLGGGMGYLARQFGLTCDNLLSARVVTADGSVVRCSADENEDLFWALRGGGGNFGVVVSFEYRLHPVSQILGGPTFFAPDADVVRAYREFMERAPEQLGALLGFVLAPPAPFVPPEWRGQPAIGVIACWTGALDEGSRLLEPMKRWGKVVGRHVGAMPYPPINQLFDDLLPPGLRQYWKANFAHELSDAAIEAHLEHSSRTPTLQSDAILFPIDGACHRVAPGDTAFAWRDAKFSTVISGVWRDASDDASVIHWVRQYHEALRPHSEAGAYVNFLDGDDHAELRQTYRGNYDRLVRAKRRWDPRNLFSVNQNIAP